MSERTSAEPSASVQGPGGSSSLCHPPTHPTPSHFCVTKRSRRQEAFPSARAPPQRHFYVQVSLPPNFMAIASSIFFTGSCSFFVFLLLASCAAPLPLGMRIHFVRGFVRTDAGMTWVILKFVATDALNYPRAPGPLRGPRWMATACDSLVRSSLAWLHVLQQLCRTIASHGRHHSSSSWEGRRGDMHQGVFLSPSGALT